MRLADAVVLVTGASGGIGRAVAIQLAGCGAEVLVHGRDPGRTAETAALSGGTALIADLTDPRQRQRLVDEALHTRGRVDAVINNAGAGWSGPITGMTGDQAAALIELNLTAPIEISRGLLPGMLERRRGAICYVTSIAGRAGVAGEAVYSSAKAGLDAFADSLRTEAQGSGVTVGVVVPGAVDTRFFAARGVPYRRRWPRPVRAERVADAVVHTVETGRAEAWVPRWLRIAPTVRALAPRPYRALSGRFGESTRIRNETSVRGHG